MKRQYFYWIKERINPQLGTCYLAKGQMSVTAAKRYEHSVYGRNIMHRFETQQAYMAEIKRLRNSGERID